VVELHLALPLAKTERLIHRY